MAKVHFAGKQDSKAIRIRGPPKFSGGKDTRGIPLYLFPLEEDVSVGKRLYRRGRIEAECARLESAYPETDRGFDSHPLRQ